MVNARWHTTFNDDYSVGKFFGGDKGDNANEECVVEGLVKNG